MWLAQIQPDSTYVGGLLGPMVVFALGLGFTFMPLTLAAVSQIDESDAGIASGVLNTTQQIGGSIGLAALTTVSVTVFANSIDRLREFRRRLSPPEQLAGAEVTAHGRRLDGRLPGLCWPGRRRVHHHRVRHQGDQGRGGTRRPDGRRALAALGRRAGYSTGGTAGAVPPSRSGCHHCPVPSSGYSSCARRTSAITWAAARWPPRPRSRTPRSAHRHRR